LDPIVLIGFMGSGKSTLGRRLAAALGLDCIDLDAQLEAARGTSIASLWRQEGERGFRALELAVLRSLLESKPADCVVVTGGGVVETPEALPLLQQLGRVVWLRADPAACVARLGPARSARPLLDDEAAWKQRYLRREPLYRAAARHVVDTHPADEEASLRALLALVDAGEARP
jgi:shikimate kinase